jgi:hypothetical protein
VISLPIDLLIKYLRNNKKSLVDEFFEVYIVVVLENAKNVFTYKEEPVVMNFEYMLQYFINFRNQTKETNPRLYHRSVGVFIPLGDSGLVCR